MFRVYYSDGSVAEGNSRGNWKSAGNTGVQVVVSFPRTQPIRWHYINSAGQVIVVEDRDLWTGEDTYNPFGFGGKTGELINDAEYFAIWERACADPAP